MKIIQTSDSDYEFLVHGVTPEQLRIYLEFMQDSPYSGTHSCHRLHFGDPGFLSLYVSASTHGARDAILDYWNEIGAELEYYDLPPIEM